jgi:mutator protein MutT
VSGAPRSGADRLQPVPVIAAVIAREGRYLVGRRPDRKRHGGLWEFPGGKLDAGERWFDAARRELAEELGMRVSAVGRLLLSVGDEGSAFLIHFVEVEATGDPVPTEHTAIGWHTPDELAAMPLAPADARVVARLRGPQPETASERPT